MSELHLFIIWEKALFKKNDILNDIQNNLIILNVYKIEWSKKNFKKNLSRLYCEDLEENNCKVDETGYGPFLMITILDHHPNYGITETSRGTEKVNLNIFRLKEKYRKWTNNGHKIHSTNNTAETNHDITLLLDINYDDYIKKSALKWNNVVTPLVSDLAGTNGWRDLHHYFYTLNATSNYVVLRKFDNYNKPEPYLKSDDDIDLLCTNTKQMALISNAVKTYPSPLRVQYQLTINNQKILADFRYIGDNYYCKKWQKNILKNRIRYGIIYIPSKIDYFYTLIYHASIHKDSLTPYYKNLIPILYKTTHPFRSIINSKPPLDFYFEQLNNFMKKHQYIFIRPKDPSVYYDSNLIDYSLAEDYVCSYWGVKSLKQKFVFQKSASGYKYFTGFSKNGKLFIKWNGLEDSVLREYYIQKILWLKNSTHFQNPLYCYFKNNIKLVAYSYLKGYSLENTNTKTLSPKVIQQLLKDLLKIGQVLHDVQIIHRDITPSNLIVTPAGRLLLIDFQFALNQTRFHELKSVQQKPDLVKDLGQEFSLGQFKWDDCHSLLEIAKQLPSHTQNKAVRDYVFAQLEQLKGTIVATLEYNNKVTNPIS